MIKLISTEIKKNKFNSYSLIALLIMLGSLFMLYTLAVISKVEQGSDADLFRNYRALVLIVDILMMCAFSILGAVIYSRVIIDEYTGKRVYLLFSYPINRKKVFSAKIILVSGFISGLMLISNILVFGIFYLTEMIFHIVAEPISISVILFTVYAAVLLTLLSSIISIFAVRIGFEKKSVQATIVTSVIITCCMCNILILGIEHIAALPITFATLLIAGIVVISNFASKIEKMEECL